MEYKYLPPRKRKLDRFILEEIGTISGSREQENTHCDSLPEIESFAARSGYRDHHSQSPQQLKIQSGEAFVKLNVTSLVSDVVGDQGRYSTIDIWDSEFSEFNENPHPESSQKNRMGSGGNNSYYPETALVKTSQQGSEDADEACDVMTKLPKASAAFNCPRSMPSDKAASVASEKIWEGSMQFNSNTTVPILAFFKSGQKLFDINWSALVVIKGKIPLEDFEKYIKDLPRSRTRKLMVISLSWKRGSSRAGLECLKEVEERDVGEFEGYPECDLGNAQVTIAISSSLETSSTDLVVSDRPALCARYHNDLSGLILSMLEPSAIEKKEPSLPSHSGSLKTSSGNLPVDSPGHPTSSKFPMSLDSSHEPRRFNSSPPLGKILLPVPNLQNSLSRHFTFSYKPRQPSSIPDVNHPSAN